MLFFGKGQWLLNTRINQSQFLQGDAGVRCDFFGVFAVHGYSVTACNAQFDETAEKRVSIRHLQPVDGCNETCIGKRAEKCRQRADDPIAKVDHIRLTKQYLKEHREKGVWDKPNEMKQVLVSQCHQLDAPPAAQMGIKLETVGLNPSDGRRITPGEENYTGV
jgi:hypothetical protein